METTFLMRSDLARVQPKEHQVIPNQSGSSIYDGGARPQAGRPRNARTIQISKHAPMNPAIR